METKPRVFRVGDPEMLRFVLDYIRDGIVMYSYMPEGDEARVGYVGMEMESGKRIFSQLAPQDDLKTYALMMMKRIDRFRKAGEYEQNGIVAWC